MPTGIAPKATMPTLDEAFEFCAKVTKQHYENFPVASLLLPADKRPYLQAVYAFARAADDFADEPGLESQERLEQLDRWEAQLAWCYEKAEEREPSVLPHPIFVALKETVTRLRIPIEPFQSLLTAFRMDVSKNRYQTFDELLEYCRHSADPVGRIVLMVFGYRSDKLFKLSDKICTALQLTNFWQDAALDFQKNRIYIPQEDFRRFGYREEDLAEGIVNEPFLSLMKFEVERTRTLYGEGADLLSLVDRDFQLELRMVWFGGTRILRKLEEVNFDVFRRRPTLNILNKIMILARGLFYGDVRRYLRPKKDLWDLS